MTNEQSTPTGAKKCSKADTIERYRNLLKDPYWMERAGAEVARLYVKALIERANS